MYSRIERQFIDVLTTRFFFILIQICSMNKINYKVDFIIFVRNKKLKTFIESGAVGNV